MKKKVLIIVLVILAVLVGVGCIFINVLNKEKTPITPEQFKTTMEENGYTVIDVTSQFEQYGDYMTKAYVAEKDGYQIEFFTLSSVENAIGMYSTNKTKFESLAGNASASYTASMNNYSIYSITTNGKYKYVSRIDNTLVYVDEDTTYQDSIKTMLKELGY